MILSFVRFVSAAVENLLTTKSTDVLARQSRHQRNLKIPLLCLPRRGGEQRGGPAPLVIVFRWTTSACEKICADGKTFQTYWYEELRLLQMKKLDGIAADHLVFFRFRHAGEISLYHTHGFGPVGLLMWKIRAPDKPIDVDFVAQLDPDSIELEPPETMFTDVFARRTLQRLE